ncbi:lasso peptide biosynthesis B2 protein, partial [Bacillus wiedmannii]
ITFSKYLYEMDEQDALIASCVSISLTNQIVLYSNGIDAKLKIGFKKIDEKLHSHAWVELENGEVIDPQNHLGKLQVMHIFKMRDGVERWVTENENVDSYVGRK